MTGAVSVRDAALRGAGDLGMPQGDRLEDDWVPVEDTRPAEEIEEETRKADARNRVRQPPRHAAHQSRLKAANLAAGMTPSLPVLATPPFAAAPKWRIVHDYLSSNDSSAFCLPCPPRQLCWR